MKYDLLIVGAGPAGLEAALQAQIAGLKFVLIDRAEAGSLIWNTMRKKKFYHSYGRNTQAPIGLLDFPDRLLGEELVNRWKLQAHGLNYMPFTALLSIKSQDGLYLCELSQQTITTRSIIIATGTHEDPKALEVPGEKNNPNISYSLDYGDIPMDQKIIVVGGGNSAVESALECALDNDVALVVRKDTLRDSVTDKNRSELQAEIERNTITPYWSSKLIEIHGSDCKIETPKGIISLPYEHIYIHIGFNSPTQWFNDLGLETNEQGLPKLGRELTTNLDNVFVVGALTGADSVVESANQAIQVVKNLSLQQDLIKNPALQA